GRRVNAPEIIRALEQVARAAGGRVPFRVGLPHKRSRGVLGYFEVMPEVVRIRTANDITTAAHELGHALEKIIYGRPKGTPWKKPLISGKLQKELSALGRALYGDTVPAGGYKREGFAEFIRIWLTESSNDGKRSEERRVGQESRSGGWAVS